MRVKIQNSIYVAVLGANNPTLNSIKNKYEEINAKIEIGLSGLFTKIKPKGSLSLSLKCSSSEANRPFFENQADYLLASIVTKLSTQLTSPEEQILRQGDPSSDMFWIIQGDCQVNIREYDNVEREGVRLLVEGMHFGEIGVLYNCPRTASVISRNYTTIAGMMWDHLREVFMVFPEFKKHLLKFTRSYNWKTKKLLNKMI